MVLCASVNGNVPPEPFNNIQSVGGLYGRRQKKVPISRPYNGTGNPVPFPFNFRAVAAQSLIAVISAGRLATVQ